MPVVIQILLRIGPAALCLAVIYGATDASEIPNVAGLDDGMISLIGHTLVSFVLAIGIWWVLGIWNFDPWQRLVLAYCGAVLFAVSNEWLQWYVPGRQSDLRNVVVDGIGAATGLFVVALLNLRLLAHNGPNTLPLLFAIILRLTPAGLIMAGIYLLSDQSTLPRPLGLSAQLIAIMGHFAVYLVLSVSIWWVLGLFPLRMWSRLLLAFSGALLFGISDEWHQSFVPGRTPDILDIAVDAFGALTGLVIVAVLHGVYMHLRPDPEGSPSLHG